MPGMASAAASVLAEEMREGPKWREGHYRYEFDLGAEGPELVKMLWRWAGTRVSINGGADARGSGAPAEGRLSNSGYTEAMFL
jgi:hypothetical protein